MSDTDFDVIVIGGGIVGLAVAARLASMRVSVVLLEKHAAWGQETSSRNSEVIHAGLYYPTGSLKARLCVEGRRSLYALCKQNNIPHRRCGKIVIALDESQIKEIESLYHLGRANGVEGLRLLDANEVQSMEPTVQACGGLFSPESGILNVHTLMDFFAAQITDHSGEIALGAEVTGLEARQDHWIISYRDSSGSDKVTSRSIVNCAGLEAQSIMRMAGLDPDALGLTGYLCKGDYFSVSGSRKRNLQHLVYPVPVKNLHGLGIHTVLGLDGSFKLGPNAYYVNRMDYTVDESARMDFFESAVKYLPGLTPEDLTPDMSGMRPKLSAPDEPARDFHIAHEIEAGAPGFFNLAGIESPGLTSSPAIGQYVARMVADYLK
jgi:L-2-hydroxyglutarate oxidase LhgO